MGLKFHICAPITLGVVGVTSRSFTGGCGSRPAGVITWTLILQEVPQQYLGGKKRPKFSAQFLTNFDFDREYLQNGSPYPKSEKYLINYV